MSKDNLIFYSKIFIFFLLFFIVMFSGISLVFGASTCTDGVDCEESINENTYNISVGLTNLNEYLSIGVSDPITILGLDDFTSSIDEFNSNTSDFLQVFGIFGGLLLFSSFFSIGLFLYKR